MMKRVLALKVVIFLLLDLLVGYYIYYKSHKFINQPTIVNRLGFEKSSSLPSIGFIICVRNSSITIDVRMLNGMNNTTGYGRWNNIILSQSDIAISTRYNYGGRKWPCWTLNTTDSILHPAINDSNTLPNMIVMVGDIEDINVYYISFFDPLTYMDNITILDYQFMELETLAWNSSITGKNGISVSYQVERRLTIKDSIFGFLFGIDLNEESLIFNSFSVTPLLQFVEFGNIVFYIPGKFGYTKSQEYRAISLLSTLADITTFVLSTILALWVFLFGSLKYKTWERAHVLLNQVPDNKLIYDEENNINNLDVVVKTFLDIN